MSVAVGAGWGRGSESGAGCRGGVGEAGVTHGGTVDEAPHS